MEGSSTGSKDGDSRASTPSKELPRDEKSTPTPSAVQSSTSRGRSAKPAASTPTPSEGNKEVAVVKTSTETKEDAP